jgi:lauroyl/myristoyl acyltransferase
MIALWGHIVGSAIIRLLPRRVWYRLADALLPLALLGWPGHVERAAGNMRRVLGPTAPEREVRRRVRQAFGNYARYMIDLLWMSTSTATDREAAVTLVGWEHIEAALARGKGMLLVTGHVGNWDLPAAVMAGRGYPVNVIVETLEPPAWNERVQGIREHVGLRAIPMESGGRELYAALRRNETVAVVFDRPLTTGGVPVIYFGAETRVPEGIARLALRTGAAVVGAVGQRPAGGGSGRIVGEISPALVATPTGDRHYDVQALTQAMMTWLEARVRQHPSQWFMFRDFWPEPQQSHRANLCPETASFRE